MGLFGKKKKPEIQEEVSAENTTSNSISDEMKIILEAREEAQQEKEAKAIERQQAQEEAGKALDQKEQNAQSAAESILEGPITPNGMNFFMVCDEVPLTSTPETEGNIIVRGNLRGTAKTGTEVFIYQGDGEKYAVKIEKIRNEDREFVDELSFARAEIEITRGDIPEAANPDEQASTPIQRFAVLSDATGIDDMKDPACKGMAAAGNPRTLAMLCEYGRFGSDEPVYFGTTMDCLMTSEFVTLAKVSSPKNGKGQVGFTSLRTKKDPDKNYIPVFTDVKIANIAKASPFGRQSGSAQLFMLSFAQLAAIARDNHFNGFIVNPFGPLTMTIDKDLIDKMVSTNFFAERFGAGAADNASLALGGTGNRSLDNFIANGGPDIPGLKKIIFRNPTNNPEYNAIEKSVKKYCGSRPHIAKLLILTANPENDPKDMSYFFVIDCKDEFFDSEVKGLLPVIKPFLRSVKKVQFQQFDKFPKPEGMNANFNWVYSKLPM